MLAGPTCSSSQTRQARRKSNEPDQVVTLAAGPVFTQSSTLRVRSCHNFFQWTQTTSAHGMTATCGPPPTPVTVPPVPFTLLDAKSAVLRTAHARDSHAETTPCAAAEKRRRNRINDRLEALREVVPHDERSSTATVLDNAYQYILDLRSRVAELEAAARPAEQVREAVNAVARLTSLKAALAGRSPHAESKHTMMLCNHAVQTVALCATRHR